MGGGHCQWMLVGRGRGRHGPALSGNSNGCCSFGIQCLYPIVFLCGMDLSVLALSVVGQNAKMLVWRASPSPRVYCRAERGVQSSFGEWVNLD